MKEKIFCINDQWDGVAVKGIANFNSKPFYFSVIFDEQLEDFSEFYELTPIENDVFALEMENWKYWLYWLENNGNSMDFKSETPIDFKSKNPHPLYYAEYRTTNSFEEIKKSLIFSNIDFLNKAEKYYQNQLLIEELNKLITKKIYAKGLFVKNDKWEFCEVDWTASEIPTR